MIWTFLLVGLGAALGAWMRWGIGAWFNPLLPILPLGTIIANLFGGFLMGITIELTKSHALLSESARLALTTGFLGALTTFSTFSGEMVMLILKHEYIWAVAMAAIHVGGSVALTMVGMYLVKLLLGW